MREMKGGKKREEAAEKIKPTSSAKPNKKREKMKIRK